MCRRTRVRAPHGAFCLKVTVRGWVAEWSKALVLGTSLLGGVGSNPTPVIIFVWQKMSPEGFEPPAFGSGIQRAAVAPWAQVLID
jgi:hypothetical protein